MSHLGEFGAAKRAADPDRERDTFELCGVAFDAADRPDPLAILEFGEAAASGLDDNDPAALAAVMALIRSAVDDADWPKFRSTVRKHRPDVTVLLELCKTIIRRESGRPTVKPFDSSDGLSPIGESSKAPSSSEVLLSPIQRDPRVQALTPLSLIGRELTLAG